MSQEWDHRVQEDIYIFPYCSPGKSVVTVFSPIKNAQHLFLLLHTSTEDCHSDGQNPFKCCLNLYVFYSYFKNTLVVIFVSSFMNFLFMSIFILDLK